MDRSETAWQRIQQLGRRAGRNRDSAAKQLNELYRSGKPPAKPLDGFYPGILVTTLFGGLRDRFVRTVAAVWMPWKGKRFSPGESRGDNILTRSTRLPAKLLWPGYRLTRTPEGTYAAFRFKTRTDPGAVDPDLQTFKIDYAGLDNPRPIVADILDEIVEISPGVFLGKVLRKRDDQWQLIGYFALRKP